MKTLGIILSLLLFGVSPVIAREMESHQMLSNIPQIYVCENFLSDEECFHLIELGKKTLKRSEVMDKPQDGQERSQVSPVRTSSGAWINWQQDTVVQNIESRIAAVTNLPVENGENFHLLNYQYKQEYKPHYDFFPDGEPTLQFGGQRAISVVIYLCDVVEGGETIFPRLGISVKPKKGSALFFHNCDPEGNPDPLTLHGSVPIEQGEKWVVTKWIRQGPFQTLRQQHYSPRR